MHSFQLSTTKIPHGIVSWTAAILVFLVQDVVAPPYEKLKCQGQTMNSSSTRKNDVMWQRKVNIPVIGKQVEKNLMR